MVGLKKHKVTFTKTFCFEKIEKNNRGTLLTAEPGYRGDWEADSFLLKCFLDVETRFSKTF